MRNLVVAKKEMVEANSIKCVNDSDNRDENEYQKIREKRFHVRKFCVNGECIYDLRATSLRYNDLIFQIFIHFFFAVTRPK